MTGVSGPCPVRRSWRNRAYSAQRRDGIGEELLRRRDLRRTITSPHFQYLRRNYQVDKAKLFIDLHSGGKTDSGYTLEQLKFHSHYCFLVFFVYLVGWFYFMKSIKHWNRLHRELLWSLLEGFQDSKDPARQCPYSDFSALSRNLILTSPQVAIH